MHPTVLLQTYGQTRLDRSMTYLQCRNGWATRTPLSIIPVWIWSSVVLFRTAFLVAVSASMALVTLLTALADVSWLWLTAPVSGMVYGAHWSLIPALASEFFGLSHFGFNYCLLGTSISLMSFSISNMMVSPPGACLFCVLSAFSLP